MGKVKVSIEPPQGRPLVRLFEASALANKSLQQLVDTMVNETWEGKDLTALDGVRSEVQASKGYGLVLKAPDKVGTESYEPVPLSAPAREYEQEGQDTPEIGLVVSGHEEVG